MAQKRIFKRANEKAPAEEKSDFCGGPDNWTVDNPTVDNWTVDNPTVDNWTVDNPTVDNWTVDNPTVDNRTVDNSTVNEFFKLDKKIFLRIFGA
uniref:Calreticulin n=1 Tax=Globodera rostochiensis TaxID=31243 RepID=A0A914GV64_GLORO